MANEIRVHTSVEIVHDVGADAGDQEGITYTSKQLDGNADSRSWGGNYTLATAYTDANVCYWKNVVVSATSADALENSGWTEASAVTDGTIPDNIYVVAVEYVSQLGTASEVNLTISGEIFATLTPGESVVIPISSNNANTAVKIHDANYSNGTREATVNVMIAGT
tara:strand:- start:1254 stop:1751 length:498 start_codon:yes stop_codon:yes gene_type:complete